MKIKGNGKQFEIKGELYSPEVVIEKMSAILTPERKERIRQVVDKRTYDIIPVLDGIHDLGNVSAVTDTQSVLSKNLSQCLITVLMKSNFTDRLLTL